MRDLCPRCGWYYRRESACPLCIWERSLREAPARTVMALLLAVLALGLPASAEDASRGVPVPAQPIFEGFAGRYRSYTDSRIEDPRAGGAYRVERSTAWQGFATLRTPAWRGLRVFGAAMTAPQSSASSARSLDTWQGAELVAGLSWDGLDAGAWSLSPSVAAGGVVAMGEDRDLVDVTPQLWAAGTRAEYSAGGASIRLYAGLGRHEGVSDGLVGIGDALVRLPLLGDRVALHVRVVHGSDGSSWRYGLVGRWW